MHVSLLLVGLGVGAVYAAEGAQNRDFMKPAVTTVYSTEAGETAGLGYIVSYRGVSNGVYAPTTIKTRRLVVSPLSTLSYSQGSSYAATSIVFRPTTLYGANTVYTRYFVLEQGETETESVAAPVQTSAPLSSQKSTSTHTLKHTTTLTSTSYQPVSDVPKVPARTVTSHKTTTRTSTREPVHVSVASPSSLQTSTSTTLRKIIFYTRWSQWHTATSSVSPLTETSDGQTTKTSHAVVPSETEGSSQLSHASHLSVSNLTVASQTPKVNISSVPISRPSGSTVTIQTSDIGVPIQIINSVISAGRHPSSEIWDPWTTVTMSSQPQQTSQSSQTGAYQSVPTAHGHQGFQRAVRSASSNKTSAIKAADSPRPTIIKPEESPTTQPSAVVKSDGLAFFRIEDASSNVISPITVLRPKATPSSHKNAAIALAMAQATTTTLSSTTRVATTLSTSTHSVISYVRSTTRTLTIQTDAPTVVYVQTNTVILGKVVTPTAYDEEPSVLVTVSTFTVKPTATTIYKTVSSGQVVGYVVSLVFDPAIRDFRKSIVSTSTHFAKIRPTSSTSPSAQVSTSKIIISSTKTATSTITPSSTKLPTSTVTHSSTRIVTGVVIHPSTVIQRHNSTSSKGTGHGNATTLILVRPSKTTAPILRFSTLTQSSKTTVVTSARPISTNVLNPVKVVSQNCGDISLKGNTFRLRTHVIYGSPEFSNLYVQDISGVSGAEIPNLSPNRATSASAYYDISTSSITFFRSGCTYVSGLAIVRDDNHHPYSLTLNIPKVATSKMTVEDGVLTWLNDRWGSWLACKFNGKMQLFWWDLNSGSQEINPGICAKIQLMAERIELEEIVPF